MEKWERYQHFSDEKSALSVAMIFMNSAWQRWNKILPICITEIKNRHTSGPEKREKHLGDLRHMVADGNPKPDKKYLFEKLQQSQSQLQEELETNAANKSQTEHRRSIDVLSSSHGSTDYSSSRRYRRDSDGPNGSRTLNRQGTRHGEFCVYFKSGFKSGFLIK